MAAIAWDALPVVSSNIVFDRIKTFLIDEKQDGRLLATTNDLFRAYCRSIPAPEEDSRAGFETCIGRLHWRG